MGDMRVALISLVIGFISVFTFGYGQSLQEYPIYEDFETDEALEDPMAEPDYDDMNIPIAKRFGSFFDQRARERYLIGKNPSSVEPTKPKNQLKKKRNLNKLKKILMECLVEKNILEAKHIKVKKPSN